MSCDVHRELSAQIDSDFERRKQKEAIRGGGAKPLCVPSQQNIYTTLKNNRQISRLQVSMAECTSISSHNFPSSFVRLKVLMI